MITHLLLQAYRTRLHKMAALYGLLDARVLRMSMMVDGLVNRVMKGEGK